MSIKYTRFYSLLALLILSMAISLQLARKPERPSPWDDTDTTRRLGDEAWGAYLAQSQAAKRQAGDGDVGHRIQRRNFLGNAIARAMSEQKVATAAYASLPKALQLGLREIVADWPDTTGEPAPDVFPSETKVSVLRSGTGKLAIVITTAKQRFAQQTDAY